MIKFENLEVVGWEHAIRGMRNAMESWDKSDSYYGCGLINREKCDDCSICQYEGCTGERDYFIGLNDADLMYRLAKAGSTHAKYRRMIVVYVDIIAPLYWFKEFDTYKVGTVANSCSTMHKIHAREFTLEDFSTENLTGRSLRQIKNTINELERLREYYIHWDTIHYSVKEADGWTDKKNLWYQMIQLLPSSYNQRRTIMMNYEVLTGIYRDRKNHKLDEWKSFCKWIEQLPYFELITLGGEVNGKE